MRTLKLIRLEISFLRRTVILIGLILSIFCMAFLSVTSVFIDVPNGLYDYIESEASRLSIAVPDVSIGHARGLGGGWVYGTKAGITTDVVLSAGSWRYVIPAYEGKTEPFAFSRTVRAFALTPDDFWHVGRHWEGILTAGEIPSQPGEFICTSGFARSYLGNARPGDRVMFNERSMTLAGIVDSGVVWDTDGAEGMPPLCSFYVCVGEEEEMDFCYLTYESASMMHRDLRSLRAAGRDVSVSANVDNALENVSNARAFFGAVAFVLGIMVLFILYSLVAIFYRQRRTQICRLKLLGAKNGTIAGIYCMIAGMLSLFAVIVGFVASIFFNFYFMDLCTQLFEAPFSSSFHPIVPLGLFGLMLAFVLALFGFYSVRIGNTRIAQEVKHE